MWDIVIRNASVKSVRYFVHPLREKLVYTMLDHSLLCDCEI
jgi:hypothetical protein